MYLVCNEPILVSRVRDVSAPLGIRAVWFIALQVGKLWREGGICEEDTVFYNYKDNEVYKLTGKDFIALLKDHNEQLKSPILDDKEKEYIRNIIRPFRHRVKYICKQGDAYHNTAKQFIRIYLNGGDTARLDESIFLPYFDQGTMYKNMKLGKNYTLKELAL